MKRRRSISGLRNIPEHFTMHAKRSIRINTMSLMNNMLISSQCHNLAKDSSSSKISSGVSDSRIILFDSLDAINSPSEIPICFATSRARTIGLFFLVYYIFRLLFSIFLVINSRRISYNFRKITLYPKRHKNINIRLTILFRIIDCNLL